MTAATEPVMTLDQLKETKEWNACTIKQRFWLETFIASGRDGMLATKCAYGFTADLHAQQHTHQVQNNLHVRAVLSLYYGRTERDDFFDSLKHRILKGTLTVAEIEGIKMMCKEKGWNTPELPDTHGHDKRKRKFKVGQQIEQNGVKFEILAVSADGSVKSVRNLQTGEIENAV